MLQDGAWVLLHGGHGGSEASFQAVVWGLVGALALAGVIEYAGLFESADDPGEDEPASDGSR